MAKIYIIYNYYFRFSILSLKLFIFIILIFLINQMISQNFLIYLKLLILILFFRLNNILINF